MVGPPLKKYEENLFNNKVTKQRKEFIDDFTNDQQIINLLGMLAEKRAIHPSKHEKLTAKERFKLAVSLSMKKLVEDYILNTDHFDN